MDNEAYYATKGSIINYEINYQLAPLHMHLWNASEIAICNIKNHFVTVFVTTDNDLPISKWYYLLNKASFTLNLLRNYQVKPYISAYAHTYGQCKFNKCPMEPPKT